MPTDPRLSLRPATPKDGITVVSMVNAMAEADKMTPLDEDAQERLISDLDRKRFSMVLAEWEGKPIGYAAFVETYSTFEARPTLYIDDLFVFSTYRGRHVGYELFRYCLRQAKERGCGRMEWRVLDWNRSAFGFYDRLQAKKLEGWSHFRLNRADIESMA